MLVLLANTTSFGQEKVNNFFIDKRGILWQRVFETSLTFKEITQQLKNTGVLRNIEVSDHTLLGDIKPMFANSQGAGFTGIETPSYMSEYLLEGFLLLEYKEGRYRVTVKNLRVIKKSYDSIKNAEQNTLEYFALKNLKNEMSDAFKRAPSAILDYTFTTLFEVKEAEVQKGW